MELDLSLKLLPTLNATLNGVTTILLVLALWAIKQKKETLHRNFMISGVFVSTLFLVSYVIYHVQVGSVPFQPQGWIRQVYFAILIPHILLAIIQLPLIGLALYYAWKNLRVKHLKIVHWAYPMWLFVSVSGVTVYLMLYHLPAFLS